MKLGKKEKERKILLYSWLLAGTYYYYSLKSGEFGPLFP